MYIDIKTPVKEIMTSNVIFVRPNDTMDKVNDIFSGHQIHHLPVVAEDGTVKGILSKSDLLRLQTSFTLFKNKKAEVYNQTVFRSLLVEEVMIKHVVKLSPDSTIEFAVGIFRENLFHAMPVVDKLGKLVGILTTYDLLNYAFREPALINRKG